MLTQMNLSFISEIRKLNNCKVQSKLSIFHNHHVEGIKN